MTLFSEASGRTVISRATAEPLGEVKYFIVDTDNRRVSGVTLGKGKKSAILPWEHITGFGPDAVMADGDESLLDPNTDREKAAAGGKLELLERRVLTDHGMDQGTVSDIEFDPGTGALVAIHTTTRVFPASALRGAGSYAVVVSETSTGDPAGPAGPGAATTVSG